MTASTQDSETTDPQMRSFANKWVREREYMDVLMSNSNLVFSSLVHWFSIMAVPATSVGSFAAKEMLMEGQKVHIRFFSDGYSFNGKTAV